MEDPKDLANHYGCLDECKNFPFGFIGLCEKYGRFRIDGPVVGGIRLSSH